MNYKEALKYLDSFINYESVKAKNFPRHFHLIRVDKLLSLIGNPHKQLKSVHIAGSKGKGSTANFLTHILKCADYKVGLYTSPHVYDFKERIAVFHKDSTSSLFDNSISEAALAQCISEIKPAIEEVRHDEELGRLSFFEVFTVAALYYFAKQRVDFAVIETGLGGRLDATNVIDSMIAIITPIGLEHTHVLGKTLDKIAAEKIAIVKTKGQGVVVSRQEAPAKEVITTHCTELKCNPVWVDDEFKFMITNKGLEGQTFVIKSETDCIPLCTKLIGDHQAENVCNAIAAVKLLREWGYVVSGDAIIDGTLSAEWPIRFEVIDLNPTIILDAAHTGESVRSLIQTVKSVLKDKRIKIILGISDDKDIKTMCAQLKEISDDIILTRAVHKRAHVFTDEDNKRYFDNQARLTHCVDGALDLALQGMAQDEALVITGSVFVASEARKLLKEERENVSV